MNVGPVLVLSASFLTIGVFLSHSSPTSAPEGRDRSVSLETCITEPSYTASPTPSPQPRITDIEVNMVGRDPLQPGEREPHFTEYLNRGLGSDDVDCDGIKNQNDNCVLVYNPDQSATVDVKVGDACNPKLKNTKTKDFRCDSDSDGIYDHLDNCPVVANPDQKDSDCDEEGDACDKNPREQLNLCAKSKGTKPKRKNKRSCR